MTGKIIGTAVLGAVGILFTVFGLLIWKRQMIGLMHDYHVKKVAPENKKAFCTLAGIGVLTIGIGLLITAAIFGATGSPLAFIAFSAGFAAGLILLIAACGKYNR